MALRTDSIMRVLSKSDAGEMLQTGLRLERVPGVLQVKANFERGELLLVCETSLVQEVAPQDVVGPLGEFEGRAPQAAW